MPSRAGCVSLIDTPRGLHLHVVLVLFSPSSGTNWMYGAVNVTHQSPFTRHIFMCACLAGSVPVPFRSCHQWSRLVVMKDTNDMSPIRLLLSSFISSLTSYPRCHISCICCSLETFDAKSRRVIRKHIFDRLPPTDNTILLCAHCGGT